MKTAIDVIDDMILETRLMQDCVDEGVPRTIIREKRKILEWAKERIKKETGWISVEDRLPDPDMNVLVVYKGFNNHLGVMEVSTDCERDGKTLDFYSHCMGIITYKVTHWMPLPLPPHK